MPFCAIQSFAKDLLCAFHIFMSRLRRVGLEPSEVIFLSPGSSLEDQGLRFSVQFVALSGMRPEVILD
jgi:hypothetical protein